MEPNRTTFWIDMGTNLDAKMIAPQTKIAAPRNFETIEWIQIEIKKKPKWSRRRIQNRHPIRISCGLQIGPDSEYVCEQLEFDFWLTVASDWKPKFQPIWLLIWKVLIFWFKGLCHLPPTLIFLVLWFEYGCDDLSICHYKFVYFIFLIYWILLVSLRHFDFIASFRQRSQQDCIIQIIRMCSCR